jgi:uncharacterized membrane protein
MDPPQGLPPAWLVAAWVALAAALGWAAWRASWARLAANEQSHLFLGAVVLTALLWTVSGRVGPLLHFHLLGATMLYLMFGAPLAVIAITTVAAAATLAGPGDWAAFGTRALVAGVLPVAISHLVLRVAEARLPANFFVYVFVAAFLGGALSMIGAGAATAAAIAFGLPAPAAAGDTWIAMVLMLAFGEATLTGMLATLFVVYKPAWMGTFSDARYLKRGRP